MPVRPLDLSGVWRGASLSHCAARPLYYRCHVRAVPAVAKGELGGRRQVRAGPVPALTIDLLFTQLTHSCACGRARLTKVR